jgi:hypothetical protein
MVEFLRLSNAPFTSFSRDCPQQQVPSFATQVLVLLFLVATPRAGSFFEIGSSCHYSRVKFWFISGRCMSTKCLPWIADWNLVQRLSWFLC